MTRAVRQPRRPLGRPLGVSLVAFVAVLLLAASLLALSAGGASGASLSSAKAKSAVVKYVKQKWGSSYAVHPACYSLSSRKSKCFVHMVHNSSSCTKYATVTLKGRRTSVSMTHPSC
jgi:hypothetical protein